jgi:hypothetical protein
VDVSASTVAVLIRKRKSLVKKSPFSGKINNSVLVPLAHAIVFEVVAL